MSFKQILAVILALVAYHLQTSSGPWFLWVPLLLGAGFLLWVPWTTVGKPRQVRNKEWDAVTPREFDLLKKKAEVAEKFSRGRNLKKILPFFLFFLLPVAGQILITTVRNKFVLWGILDVGFLLLVVLFSGRVSLWTPGNLDVKARVLCGLLEKLEKRGGFEVFPQLLVGEVRSGKKVPVDARIFAVPEEAPPWLIGIQFQVAINRVQSRPYPYFYAVIVLKPGTLRERFGYSALLSTRRAFSDLKKACGVEDRDLTVEFQKGREVDVIIIRQRTSRNSGFFTDERRAEEIFEEALKILYCVMKDEKAEPS